MLGRYPEETVAWWGEAFPAIEDGDMEVISTAMDFVGIDYYCQSVVADDPEANGAGGAGEEIGAAGPLDDTLARMLTVKVVPHDGAETGIGWPVTPDGLANSLEWLRDRYDNPPIIITEIGSAWSDEPDAEGFVEDPGRIGLVRVDYGTQERTIKASGRWWGEVAAANGLRVEAGK